VNYNLHDLWVNGPTWPALRALYRDDALPQPWQAARSWMLDSFEAVLGERWPQAAWQKRGALPVNLAEGAGHHPHCANLIELALRLRALSQTTGFDAVKRQLRSADDEEAVLHVALQLEVATLCQLGGADVRFEELGAGSRWPADVVVSWNRGLVAVETFSVFTDAEWRANNKYDQLLSQRLLRLRIEHDVSLGAVMTARLSEEETNTWLDRVAEAAETVRRTEISLVIETGPARVQVEPRDAPGAPGFSFRSPISSANSWPRLRMKLRKKIRQAQGSRPTVLRLDLLDGIWQFTPWSTGTLAEKQAGFDRWLRAELPAVGHVVAVIVSSGARMSLGRVDDETVHADQSWALRRNLPPFRVRETIGIALNDDSPALDLFANAYHHEPESQSELLSQFGLGPLGPLQ
jgi:hypothetical protein